MARGRAATIAVNVALFAVLAELAGVAAYYVRHGGFFYLHRAPAARAADTAREALTADALHPYFGPTHRPGHPFSMPEALRGAPRPAATRTNNFGFVSVHDYPYAKRDDREIVVGLFGGSVGLWFCQLGAERLAERLTRLPPFAGRDIISLCFSHEGYKQPQQAIVLAYFLSIGQEFDLVVNIDGFNEVALGALNDRHGLDISMPSVMHVDPIVNLVNQRTLTPEKLASLAEIERRRRQLDDLAARIDRARLASLHFVLEQWHQVVSNRLVAERFRFAALPSAASESSLVHITPTIRERTGGALFEDIARNWASASMLMHDLLAARSVPYVHVLQPNQYHTRRRFEPGEARVALNDASPFKPGVEQGYPALLRVAGGLRQRVRLLDATGLFDDEAAPVYIDDCCHYSAAGNRLLADYIAGNLQAAR